MPGDPGLAEGLGSTSAVKRVVQVSLNPSNRRMDKPSKWKLKPWMLLVIWRMDFFGSCFLEEGKLNPGKLLSVENLSSWPLFLALFFSNVVVFLKRPSAGGFLTGCLTASASSPTSLGKYEKSRELFFFSYQTRSVFYLLDWETKQLRTPALLSVNLRGKSFLLSS